MRIMPWRMIRKLNHLSGFGAAEFYDVAEYVKLAADRPAAWFEESVCAARVGTLRRICKTNCQGF